MSDYSDTIKEAFDAVDPAEACEMRARWHWQMYGPNEHNLMVRQQVDQMRAYTGVTSMPPAAGQTCTCTFEYMEPPERRTWREWLEMVF